MLAGEEFDKDIHKWSVDEVSRWLRSHSHTYTEECIKLLKRNKIDGFCLLHLQEADLRQEPMKLQCLGDIIHLLADVRALRKINEVNSGGMERSDSVDSVSQSPTSRHLCHGCCEHEDVSDVKRFSVRHRPEAWKVLISFVYCSAVLFMVAVIMVIVNDRVPDREKYPPLPDLFLDNVPFIPWAFHAAEYIMIALGVTFLVILALHKHRCVIMRRFFALMGTLYLLRGVCMLITSLSVPSTNFKCVKQVDDGVYSKMWRAMTISASGGMSLQGMRYCGDYMFSGHTTTITLFNLFIDTYVSAQYSVIKTLGWVLNIFGIFFVMAGHEHYSIDVFIAFYLTTRLFLYYHTLADNLSRLQYGKENVRVWFPLFSYFESECEGAVPNHYQWPSIYSLLPNSLKTMGQPSSSAEKTK